jgi:hypothetical protein
VDDGPLRGRSLPPFPFPPLSYRALPFVSGASSSLYATGLSPAGSSAIFNGLFSLSAATRGPLVGMNYCIETAYQCNSS